MAHLYQIMKPEVKYYDRKNYSSQQQYNNALKVSTTVYVGNLSFYTTQDSIRQLFSRAGVVKEIIMGINNQGNPCGFCFVIFETHQEALYAVQYISKTNLNQRIIRVDWDPGYQKGRQKGRGTQGQQRRDDFRTKQDIQRPTKRINNYQKNDRGGNQQKYEKNDRYQKYEKNDRNYKSYKNDRNANDFGEKVEKKQKKEEIVDEY